MPIQGSPLYDTNVIGAPLGDVKGIPIGRLIDTDISIVSDVTSTNYIGRFPYPPAVFGFLIDVTDDTGEEPAPAYRIPPNGLKAPYVLAGALSPPGSYLEPTTGQIWPRSG